MRSAGGVLKRMSEINERIMLISFLSMHILAKLRDAIRKTGLLSKHSAEDVLTEYSGSCAVAADSGAVDRGIPDRSKITDKKTRIRHIPYSAELRFKNVKFWIIA